MMNEKCVCRARASRNDPYAMIEPLESRQLQSASPAMSQPMETVFAGSQQSASALPQLQLTVAAHAGTSVLTGTSTAVSAQAIDPTGTSRLTYTWSVLQAPAGAGSVTFADNGTFAARKSRAMFHKAGGYVLRCTISDGGARQIVTDTAITVEQTATRVRIAPATSAIFRLGIKQLSATVNDQFDKPMHVQPAIVFSIVSGEGLIDPTTGLFTGTTLPGLVEIAARAGKLVNVASVTVE